MAGKCLPPPSVKNVACTCILLLLVYQIQAAGLWRENLNDKVWCTLRSCLGQNSEPFVQNDNDIRLKDVDLIQIKVKRSVEEFTDWVALQYGYWSLGSALIGAFLVLNRFVTVAYLLGVLVGFALFCGIITFCWRRDADLVSRMRRRLLNLGLFTVLLIVATVPILLHNWRSIEGYYVVGHAVGEEKYVRAAVLGIKDLQGHLSFYPKSIIQDHLGKIFLQASAIAIVCGILTRLSRRRWPGEPVIQRNETLFLQMIFLVGAILGPLVVLTADISKSAVVGGIVGGPTALLVVAVTASVASRPGQREPVLVRRLFAAGAVAVFGFGLYNQLSQASRHWPAYAPRDDLKQLDELDKSLVDLASEYGWSHPGVSYDVITGWLNAGPPTISAFEQSRKLIEFQPMIGNGVLGVDRAQAMSLLEQSDFAIFTTLPKKGVYPFYQRIAKYCG